MVENLMIVEVNEKNFDEFFALICELAKYEKLEAPDEKAKQRMLEHATQENPLYHAYLGLVDGKPVGYLIYFFTYSSFLGKPTLYLEDIFVQTNQRRKGIGLKMFQFCIEKARIHECGRMEWCALDWNTGAHDFYEKLGARKLDEWIYFRLNEEKINDIALRK